MPCMALEKRERIEELLLAGESVLAIVAQVKSSPNAVYRIRDEMGDFSQRCGRCGLAEPHECVAGIEQYATNRRERP